MTMPDKPRCPECGSTDVDLLDPETAYCNECEFEGRAGAFEPSQKKPVKDA